MKKYLFRVVKIKDHLYLQARCGGRICCNLYIRKYHIAWKNCFLIPDGVQRHSYFFNQLSPAIQTLICNRILYREETWNEGLAVYCREITA